MTVFLHLSKVLLSVLVLHQMLSLLPTTVILELWLRNVFIIILIFYIDTFWIIFLKYFV